MCRVDRTRVRPGCAPGTVEGDPDPVTVTPTVLAADIVVADTATHTPGWVSFLGSTITGVGAGDPAIGAVRFPPGTTLLPGALDIHNHGGAGHGFALPSRDGVETAVGAHRRRGTTSLLASLVSSPIDELCNQVAFLRECWEDDLILGTHLEGPWLSPARAGAHNPAHLSTPQPGDVRRLLAAAGGSLRMLTLAPEVHNATATIRELVEHDVIVAVGHTDADEPTTRAAIDAGASVATHLFNAMRLMHHRDPGPTLALLSDPCVTVELINDGHHLHPAVVRHAIAASTDRGWVLVSDALPTMGTTGAPQLLGGLVVREVDGVALIDGTATLAGGSSALLDAVARTIAIGVSRRSAVGAASAVPADLLGRPDLGRLNVGARADVIAVDEHWCPIAIWHRGVPAPGHLDVGQTSPSTYRSQHLIR